MTKEEWEDYAIHRLNPLLGIIKDKKCADYKNENWPAKFFGDKMKTYDGAIREALLAVPKEKDQNNNPMQYPLNKPSAQEKWEIVDGSEEMHWIMITRMINGGKTIKYGFWLTVVAVLRWSHEEFFEIDAVALEAIYQELQSHHNSEYIPGNPLPAPSTYDKYIPIVQHIKLKQCLRKDKDHRNIHVPVQDGCYQYQVIKDAMRKFNGHFEAIKRGWPPHYLTGLSEAYTKKWIKQRPTVIPDHKDDTPYDKKKYPKEHINGRDQKWWGMSNSCLFNGDAGANFALDAHKDHGWDYY